MPETNPIREQSNVPPSTNTENYDAAIEMFADQLANLLWQQWMYEKENNQSKPDFKRPELV